jgi:hypothetical protein
MLRRFAGVATLVAALAAVSGASSAYASEVEAFKQCPVNNPSVSLCVVAVASSGEFVVGIRKVPIKHPVTLQGGLAETSEEGVFEMVAATNGETLSATPQTVPGGLVGIEGLGGEVTATTELAGPASAVKLNPTDLAFQEGTALSLPVKLKVGNPILGNHCYGGSNQRPIVLNLTTGTTSPPPPNKPISGSRGEPGSSEGGAITELHNDSLVNNSFAAPGVEGCGLVPFFTDPLVDVAMGVPAPEGHNTAILTGTIKITSAEFVKEHL